MLFTYQALDQEGKQRSGTIDAVSEDVAITSLQRRGLTISSIESAESRSLFEFDIKFFSGVSNKDVVVISRQIATLFEAQVSALRVFKLLAVEAENENLQKALLKVTDDLQGGSSISNALSKHPDIFTPFYVNMVKAGEETGKLDETFSYLADYLDRNYELSSKARSALIYPAFVISVFIAVMVLMLTFVIPRIGQILVDSGQEIPVYTKIVLGLSGFFVSYGVFLFVGLAVGGFLLWRYVQTDQGKLALDTFRLSIPYVGTLYRKLYLSRFSDNLSTMLASGIPMVRAIEITAEVIGSVIYEDILIESMTMVKNGNPLSKSLGQYEEMPSMVVGMIRVGEESGELGKILKTLATFYNREVRNAVDALVDLIEPAMIVLLGLGVGVLLASVMIPIYNVSTSA